MKYLSCLIVFLSCSFGLAAEQTLAIIKPNAVKAHHIGEILDIYEKNGLSIAALKMTKVSPEDAGCFYHIHKEKPFFTELTKFMSSGPIVAVVLEGDNAVMKNREIMGATNPKEAKEGTIRAKFGKSIGENSIHGSDSPMSAVEEIHFFFKPDEIYNRKLSPR